MAQDYDIVIGLEIHAELKTNSKIFCGCKNEFGSNINSNVCPVCLGLPGALPILNKEAVKKTIKAGLSVGCSINNITVFERKHYFYPDNSKAYQISQLEKPICLHGGIELDSGKFIELNRIHLEEDAGKLIHYNENIGSLVDYNRGGVPLIEIVTEPVISSAEEAVEFVTKLRDSLIYTGVAECKMEEGGMRCDVNLSIKPKGSKQFGTKTEMKNLNSFKMIARAIASEAERQIECKRTGERIVQETRKWDDESGKSFSMRSKETALDYKYFPDPDILTVSISNEDIEKIRATVPLMPGQLKKLFTSEYALPEYDADVIIKDRPACEFFQKCVALYNQPKTISNYLMTNIMAKVKTTDDGKIGLTPSQFTDIIKAVDEKKISRQNGTILFDKLWNTEDNALTLAKELGMINDLSDNDLFAIIETVLKNNPKAISDYMQEGEKILNFLTGQVMKETKGKADSRKVKEYLLNKLNS